MRLFGKKSNTGPEITDVPPELRPYYREQAVSARRRRNALRLAFVFVIIIVLAGGGLWGWLNRATIKPKATHHTPTTSISQTPSNQPTPTPNKNTGQDKPPTAATPTAPSNNSNIDTSDKPTPSPSSPSNGSSAPTTPPPTTPIPNTGPGTMIMFIALGFAVIGMGIYHMRQRRIARQQ